MSNYPPTPSFWGPSNNSYTQQWGSHPPPSGSMPHSTPFNQDAASAPPPSQGNNGQNLDYSNHGAFFANAHLPNLGGPGAAGALPPPFPFPGPFPTSQFPPPPFLTQIPNMGYHLPIPHAPAPPSRPSTRDFPDHSQPNAPYSQPMTTLNSPPDIDREEGELTDMESPPPTRPTSNPNVAQSHRIGDKNLDAQLPRKRHEQKGYGSATRPKDPEPDPSDLEEGEASPEPQTTNRESGSPYNPPISMGTGPSFPALKTVADASIFPRPINENSTAVTASLPSSKPPHLSGSATSSAGLRVQAQGALLSLAPHSIRFKELVGEGINPVVLKQLYEDVGIKVPISPAEVVPTTSSSSEDSDRSDGSQNGVVRPTEQRTEQSPTKITIPPKLTVTEAATTSPPSTQTNARKPMERKEVIARMLAAKAAQNSRASAPPQTGTPAPANMAAEIDKSTASTPLQDLSSKEKEVRVKEKNKAQTELARQRIELLKKQGLMRNPQKIPQEHVIPENEQSSNPQDATSAQSSLPIQHPLPERPPDPSSTLPARIPGLFMTEQAEETSNGTYLTPVQGLVVDSTPQPRASQRKRPRASDFDEPIPVPKKTFSDGMNHSILERLVIDISDDEFYGDDEDGSMDVDTLSGDALQEHSVLSSEVLTRSFQPSIENLPHRLGKSPSQGLSLSSTPLHGRNTEQEDLRRKDLEIQAMHRKIAELEQRKKARLASRTQSPRTSDLSVLSPPENSTTIESTERPLVPAECVVSEIPEKKQTDITLSPDLEHWRELKSKFLRKEEIESGVPSLDAVIYKCETRLSEFKKEEEELLSQIAKGKNGRRQLLEELTALNVELNGLSLDQVDAILDGSEISKDQAAQEEAQTFDPRTSDKEVYPVQEAHETELESSQGTGSVEESNPPGVAFAAVTPVSIAPDDIKDIHATVTPNNPIKESSNASMSEDSGSAMDESTDSSSTSSASADQEMTDDESSGTGPVAPENAGESPDVNTENSDKLNAENLQNPLPDNLQFADTEPGADIESSIGQNAVESSEDLDSNESVVSEAYEPPEPEATASPDNFLYSPSFSPAFPPAEPMEVTRSPENQSHNTGEPLTGKVQELDLQQPSPYIQVGPLDNKRHPEESHRTFTPYVSPLQLFKAYRYHPNYTDNVSGGYRSLTYSHNIDPMKYLCPFEAAGGICNDRSCEFQHFRDMSLSDDKVLVQMGSLREGKTPEESDNYIAGLKQIINDMRRDKVKDFNTVATEIAAYRRRFLQDPSRVLPL